MESKQRNEKVCAHRDIVSDFCYVKYTQAFTKTNRLFFYAIYDYNKYISNEQKTAVYNKFSGS